MDILTDVLLGKPLWVWGVFIVLILGLMTFDLGILHRKYHAVKISESLWLSLFYILMGVSYGAWIWFYMGGTSASEYMTGYLVEKTLSLDNIFVMSLIFNYLEIPDKYQHRVLLLGILGVIVLRGLMIFLGASLISRFEWVSFLFAGFLIITGAKMLIVKDREIDLASNPLLLFLRRIFRITPNLHGHKFFVLLESKGKSGRQLWATPLFLALVLIELGDLIFAVDSIPAIFTITHDPYIAYTSNIFAVLGLRALYFALAAVVGRFHYLKYSLAIVLIFIGSKPFLAWGMNEDKFPAPISLVITLGLILSGILFSIYKTKSAKNLQR